MPAASGAHKKYAWMDHDPAFIDIDPPVQNTWYEVYHNYDVRQILMSVKYKDDEEDGATVEVKWTCDGNIYTIEIELDNNYQLYVYKNKYSVLDIEDTLSSVDWGPSALFYQDKRALEFKVEIRVTSVVGTNAHLYGYALYETLEET